MKKESGRRNCKGKEKAMKQRKIINYYSDEMQ